MPILRVVGWSENDAPLSVGLSDVGQMAMTRWPDSGLLGDAGGAMVQGGGLLVPCWYEFRVKFSGQHSWKQLRGITKDARLGPPGTPLAGVTCMAIRTTEDVANSRPANVQEGSITVSDAEGNYEVGVPTTNQYQVKCYKTGSPDLAGLTINTLVGGDF